ncbi:MULTISPECIES: hypothetical protein [Pseudomonas]|uniref:hypothetical protein n=1 Tax=Pseudomonas TaxID=286 RepID=UPI001F02C8EF|nr:MULTISPECIES: hypothetical protein [Pseudomonas]MCG8292368.1 hypothetical protein [Pseudomonas entomophila]
MPMQQVNLGTPPSAVDGDSARTAFTRINDNFKALDAMGVSGPAAGNRAIQDCNLALAPGLWLATSGIASNRPPGLTYVVLRVSTTEYGAILQEAVDIVYGDRAVRTFNPNNNAWGHWISSSSQGGKTLPGGGNIGGPGIDTQKLHSGFYGYYQGPGEPGGALSVLETLWHADPQWSTQLAMGVSTNELFYRSISKNSTVPPAFARVYTSQNILGAVSGVAAGGIIESGSNANGNYTKFADGTLMCTGSCVLPAAALNAEAAVNVVFAATFAQAPKVVASAMASAAGTGSQADVGLVNMNGTYMTITASGMVFRSWTYRYAVAAGVVFHYMATGRWR